MYPELTVDSLADVSSRRSISSDTLQYYRDRDRHTASEVDVPRGQNGDKREEGLESGRRDWCGRRYLIWPLITLIRLLARPSKLYDFLDMYIVENYTLGDSESPRRNTAKGVFFLKYLFIHSFINLLFIYLSFIYLFLFSFYIFLLYFILFVCVCGRRGFFTYANIVFRHFICTLLYILCP